ncbi:hypothetical protein CYMTET_13078 [Cymbomonas tetramitiformis]|uniref:Uncharacterized protein n=1 Tax=Cymbomonas tetramitiformis TaxID=36881 RepID=A0AAE0LBJ5_9CHLO|nr:hypothetical protein CYMTET_13078 [Cymbomonas tetramitiformis]
MASCRQRARISAVTSALHVIRRRELTHGYDLVVSGGAHGPDTKIESINHIVNMSFDHCELTPQHPPLFPPPCVPLGHCLGWCLQVLHPSSHHFSSLFSHLCAAEWSHTAFSTFAPLGVSTSPHSLCWYHTSSHRIAWALDDDVLAALDFVHHRDLRRRPPSITWARFAGWPVGVVIPTAHAWA